MKNMEAKDTKEKRANSRKAAKKAKADADRIEEKIEEAQAENSVSIDSAILLDITRQLSEINDNISGRQPYSPYDEENSGNSNLFGFELKSSATTDEYRRYFTFLDTITEVLSEFGIHLGNNGYAYIMDAVKIIIDRNSFDMRLKSDIYPLIARRYRLRSTDTVEHSIRNAINKAYKDYRSCPGSNSMDVFSRKPTNKQFLVYIASAVLRAMYDSLAENAG